MNHCYEAPHNSAPCFLSLDLLVFLEAFEPLLRLVSIACIFVLEIVEVFLRDIKILNTNPVSTAPTSKPILNESINSNS